MKNIFNKKTVAVIVSASVVGASIVPTFAATTANTMGQKVPPTKVEETVSSKKLLTYEDAIKKALEYSISNKSADVQIENLQKKADDIYKNSDGIFQITDPTLQAGQVANFDVYTTTISTSKELVNRQKSVESENLRINIAGGFNNIEQQQNTVELVQAKIAQGKKNIDLANKQYSLGLISKLDLDKMVFDNNTLENSLVVEMAKLDQYYAELEKITGIKNLRGNYEIVPLEMNYEELILDDTKLESYKNDVLNFDIGVLAKENAAKNKEVAVDNYTAIYNLQVLSYMAGMSSTPPSYDYDSTNNDKYVAQLDLSQTKNNAKINVQKNYTSLQSIQNNIAMMQSQLDSLNLQVDDMQKKYALGMISKNVLENLEISQRELENNLAGLQTQHKLLKMMFQSPYFAGVALS